MPDLCACDVSFGYAPGVDLFDRFDLKIAAGGFHILLGPNGSGKTTLLRILAGALRPRRGVVRLGDRVLDTLPPRERAKCIALLPQETRVVFPFTARQVVEMGRAPHLGLLGFPGRDDRALVAEAMRETDCLRFSDRPIGSLSSGERQRVFLARALAQQPRILLLDEPTTFLDMSHQIRLEQILDRLHRERGITIVAISHNITLAGRPDRRLVLLHRGRVAAAGDAATVLHPDRLREVYGVEVRVVENPVGGGRLVLPEPRPA